MNYFQNKVALITGAAGGIGKSVAGKLIQAGAKVVIADYNGDLLQQTAAELQCDSVQYDVSDLEQTQDAVEEVTSNHGPIDLLFNNAGMVQTGETHSFDYEQDWKRVIDVNIYGVVNGVHVVYPQMIERGEGHIINTASIAGLFPMSGQISYVTSKYAVVGLSHALRAEAAAHGVNVTVVCPGIIQTRMRTEIPVRGLDPEKLREILPEGMPVDQCADEIIKGVQKNEGTIVVTPMAQLLWLTERLNSDLGIWLSEQLLNYIRTKTS